MRFGIILITVGLVLVALALFERSWSLIRLWLGLNIVTVGIAHLRGAHRLFGKRPTGTIPWWSWFVFSPFCCLTYAIWHLSRLLVRIAKANEVSENLTIGRRLLAGEVDGQFANYVDLTAEFRVPQAIRGTPAYLSFPILDGGAPDARELLAFISRLRPGRTFVHCAQGLGRTGLFAVALLLYSNTARSVEDALKILRSVRPGVRLNRNQWRCAEAFARELRAPASS